MSLSVVVFPEPLRPSSTSVSPRRMFKLTPATISLSLIFSDTSRNSITDSIWDLGFGILDCPLRFCSAPIPAPANESFLNAKSKIAGAKAPSHENPKLYSCVSHHAPNVLVPRALEVANQDVGVA